MGMVRGEMLNEFRAPQVALQRELSMLNLCTYTQELKARADIRLSAVTIWVYICSTGMLYNTPLNPSAR